MRFMFRDRSGGWRNKRAIVPRLEFGRKLVGVATACMDISDGLALDLHRMCKARALPRNSTACRCSRALRSIRRCTMAKITNCLYTAPPRVKAPGIRIGSITQGKPGSVRYAGKALKPIGYDHTRQHH